MIKKIHRSIITLVIFFALFTWIIPSNAKSNPLSSILDNINFRKDDAVVTPTNEPSENETVSIKKPTHKPKGLKTVVIKKEFDFPKVLNVSPNKKPLPLLQNTRLSLKNRQLYKEIFALQKKGQWRNADVKIQELSDMRLLGYIAYDRYKHPKYNSSETELRDWISVYGDYAISYEVYKLAKHKFATYFKRPKKQKTFSHKVVLQSGTKIKPYTSRKRYSKANYKAAQKLKRQISNDLSRDAPTRALKRLNDNENAKYLDNIDHDIILADIAAAYFYLYLFDKAKPLALQAANRSGAYAPLAGWIAGLCNWRERNYKDAGHYFEVAAKAKRNSNWMRSAASYWAARSYMRNANPNKGVYWLKNASRYPRSFYGLIAMQSMGMQQHSYDWSNPQEEDESHINAILKTDNGYRSVALLDVEQIHMAMKELRRINLNPKDAKLKEALFILANRYNMPGIAMQLASTVKRPNGKLYDTALYPSSPWSPNDGFTVSPALVHAFIRQESRFNPYVTSRSGAAGLMQLMPTTASYLAKESKSHFKNKNGREELLDPVLNMTLGQKYLDYLLKHSVVDNNLFQLAAAYNAGPGRLSRWKNKMAKEQNIDDDPLLFIEMLSAAETRGFIEHVLANYWIYNLRFHGNTPKSLRDVASGKWPIYTNDKYIELADR